MTQHGRHTMSTENDRILGRLPDYPGRVQEGFLEEVATSLIPQEKELVRKKQGR